MKSVCILGSTGSIGCQTLEIIEAFPDRYSVYALSAYSRVEELAEQARHFHAQVAVIMREDLAPTLREALAGTSTRVLSGMAGLEEVASADEVDIVLTAMVGSAGLLPLLAAANAGKIIALANKEPLVAAGQLVMEAVSRGQATILPVDSEPSAIFQCLQGEHQRGISRLLLTASGGALKDYTPDALARVTPEEALRHPTWTMGCKITIDSATLMNKGLEIIEAHWLFGIPLDRIDVLIHPQSIVHSLVEFCDGSLLAQLGMPTMRTPIQYALGFPERLPKSWEPLDLTQLGSLSFARAEFSRFPCLDLAKQAALAGGTMPTCLNAANEVAVAAFVSHQVGFLDIPRLVERALAAHSSVSNPSLEAVLAVDHAIREEVAHWVRIR